MFPHVVDVWAFGGGFVKYMIVLRMGIPWAKYQGLRNLFSVIHRVL